jgi:GNAT superfamily N-acetyltransferase
MNTESSMVGEDPKPPQPMLAAPQWVPAKRLGERDRGAIAQHLLQLNADDRYLRFGHAASDEQIERYVNKLRMGSDQLIGVYNRQLQLVAMVHLAGPTVDVAVDEAELGISVSAHLRGKGYGKRLFEHAMLLCRNRGITTLRIHALSENRVMLHLAQSAGAQVERDGSEAEAVLKLPRSNVATWWEAWLEDRAAYLDFTFKQWSLDPDTPEAQTEEASAAVPSAVKTTLTAREGPVEAEGS